MKKFLFIAMMIITLVACNKEEENDQLVGWDKITEEVGKTSKSVMEVLQNVSDDEVWFSHNLWYYIKEESGEIKESKAIENGVVKYVGDGTHYEYRMADNNTIIHYFSSWGTMAGMLNYYRPYDVEEVDGNFRVKYFFNDELQYTLLWEIIAYDDNQILIKSTDEYRVPVYDSHGNLYKSNTEDLYTLIHLVRRVPKDDGWKEVITEQEYCELVKQSY